MSASQFNQELLSFLRQSPTAFHAVASMCDLLDAAGFERLDEGNTWQLQRNKAYYVIRNDSALIAFRTGRKALLTQGMRMAGAHTDSPCLKVKPNPDGEKQGYEQIGVECTGERCTRHGLIVIFLLPEELILKLAAVLSNPL